MTEAVTPEVVVPEEVVETVPAVNPEETKATEDGWMPLEKWTEAGNTPESHRSAREFNDRGELLRKITDQNKYIQRMAQGVERLQQHNQKVYENAYQKALVDLKAQHKAAVEAGELGTADKLVDQISDTKAALVEQKVRNQTAPQPIPELEAWREKNTWYDSDQDMKIFADGVAAQYVQSRNGMVQVDEVLKHVEKRVKDRFMKVEPKVAAPNPVAGTDNSRMKAAAQASHGLKKSDLTEDERKAMKDFVSMKLGDEASYLKQLAEIR